MCARRLRLRRHFTGAEARADCEWHPALSSDRFCLQHADLHQETGEVIDAALSNDLTILELVEKYRHQMERLAAGRHTQEPMFVPLTLRSCATRLPSTTRLSVQTFRSRNASNTARVALLPETRARVLSTYVQEPSAVA